MTYRDKQGRFRQRNGLDILNEIGACVVLALTIWGAGVLIVCAQAMEWR